MFFKMMSGDVICLETDANTLLEEQLSNVIGVPSHRIHLLEGEDEEVYHVVVTDAMLHHWELERVGLIYDEDDQEYEDYVLRLCRYDPEMENWYRSKEEQDWSWDKWEIPFYYREGKFLHSLYDLRQYSLREVVTDRLREYDVPEDTLEFSITDELQKAWDERPR